MKQAVVVSIASIARDFKMTSASSFKRLWPLRKTLLISAAGKFRALAKLLYRFSVSCRRHPSKTSKMPVEVSQIGKSHLIRDHAHRSVALHKPHASPPDS